MITGGGDLRLKNWEGGENRKEEKNQRKKPITKIKGKEPIMKSKRKEMIKKTRIKTTTKEKMKEGAKERGRSRRDPGR